MLNTYKIGGNTSNVSFNAPCTGIIQKSHPKSRFIDFHIDSAIAKWLLHHSDEPYIERIRPGYTSAKDNIPVTVLQIMMFGDKRVMAEIVENTNLIDIE